MDTQTKPRRFRKVAAGLAAVGLALTLGPLGGASAVNPDSGPCDANQTFWITPTAAGYAAATACLASAYSADDYTTGSWGNAEDPVQTPGSYQYKLWQADVAVSGAVAAQTQLADVEAILADKRIGLSLATDPTIIDSILHQIALYEAQEAVLQGQITDAYNAALLDLWDAIEALQERVSTRGLADLLDSAQFPDPSSAADYTPESWAASGYQAAYEAVVAATQPGGNANLDAQAVKDLELALLRAVVKLVKVNDGANPTVTVTEPGPTVTVTEPGQTATIEVPVPGQTATVVVPGGTVTAPGATVTVVQTASGVPAPNPSLTAQQNPASVIKAKAAQSTVTIAKGKKISIAAYGYTAAGAASKVTWKSSKAKVAKVSASGVIKGVKAGKATITVTAAGKKATIKVTVVAKKTKAKVKKVTVKGVPTKLKVGAVAYAAVTYTSKTATAVKVTYKSSNKTVLDVDKAGRVIAKAAGTAKLTAQAGKKKAKAITVTVSK
jgi:hypothetical protein